MRQRLVTLLVLGALLAGCMESIDGPVLVDQTMEADQRTYELVLSKEPSGHRLTVDVTFYADSPDARFQIVSEDGSWSQPSDATWVYARSYQGCAPCTDTLVFELGSPHADPATLVFSWENPVGVRVVRNAYEVLLEDGRATVRPHA